MGSPLDGEELDPAGWTDGQIHTGTYEIAHGWAERGDYEPDPSGDPLVWHYRGPAPG